MPRISTRLPRTNTVSGALRRIQAVSIDNSSFFDGFGRAVAISGDLCVIGAPFEDPVNQGRAYVFSVTTGALRHTLTNPNAYGTDVDDRFGTTVAIEGDYIAVSATLEDSEQGLTVGAVYVFSAVTGELLHSLTPPTVPESTLGLFGSNLAISQGLLAVAAPGFTDTVGNTDYTSSGRVFFYDVATGEARGTVTNPDVNPDQSPSFFGDAFGSGLDLNENYCVIGAMEEDSRDGAAYLYDRTNLASGEIDPLLLQRFQGLSTGGQILDFARQDDGKIIAVGTFTSYLGVTAPRIIRFNADFTIDTTFLDRVGSGANNTIWTVDIEPNGSIVIGGDFTQFNGFALNRIARLNRSGSLATNPFSTGFNNRVNVIRAQDDGTLLVGGFFTEFRGSTKRYLTKLTAAGFTTTYPEFDFPEFGGTVRDILILSDGSSLVIGDFTSITSEITRRDILKVTSSGTAVGSPGWVAGLGGDGFNNLPLSIAAQSNGKIVVGGSFTTYDANVPNALYNVNRILRFNADGEVDTDFITSIGTGFNGTVNKVYVQPDDKIICMGAFTSFNGTGVNRIVRLNYDGTLDTTFESVGASTISAFLSLPNKKLLIGGTFSSYQSITQRLITVIQTGLPKFNFSPPEKENSSVQFGKSVALSEDLCLIGAPGTFLNSSLIPQGAVYVYSAVTGELIHELLNPVPISGSATEQFGNIVVANPDRFVIRTVGDGSSGRINVYERRSRLRITGIEIRGDFSSPIVEWLELHLPGDNRWYRYTSSADDAVYRPAQSTGNSPGTWQGPAEVMSGHFLEIESQVPFAVNVSPTGMPDGLHWQARLTIEVENILGSVDVRTIEFGGQGNGASTVGQNFKLILDPTFTNISGIRDGDAVPAIDRDRLILGVDSAGRAVDTQGSGAAFILGKPKISYEMTSDTSVDEGSSLVVSVDTNNVSKGSKLYWQVFKNDVGLSLTLDNFNAYGTISADRFGAAVAISGDLCIIGAYSEDDAGGEDSGKVYIIDVNTGSLLHTLNNPNDYGASAVDWFGWSVDISGDRCIVGAQLEDDVGNDGINSGRAYIFDVVTGDLLHTLDNPNVYGTSNSDFFGYSVAIDGDRCIVGAYQEDSSLGSNSGKAYIFDVSAGTLLYTLDNPNAYGTELSDLFGFSVSISGNKCIVGAYGADDFDGENSGKAYIFSVSTGQLLHTLRNPSPNLGERFGYSVSMTDNRCIVGAPLDLDVASGSGKAYIFDVTSGTLIHTLDNPNVYSTATSDGFASSVSISDNICIAGTPYEDDESGSNSGKLYVFSVISGELLATIDNPNAYGTVLSDNFGDQVAIDGTKLIVGSQFEDDEGGLTSGKAYIFEITETTDNLLDFVENSGVVEVNGNTTTFSVTPFSDATQEGAEFFGVELRNSPSQIQPLNRLELIKINDTSVPALTISGPDAIDEGDSASYTIEGLFLDGSPFYWSTTGQTTPLEGTVEMTSNSATINFTATADFLTEGNQNIILDVKLGNSSGPLGVRKFITINDTSVETYGISPAADNVNEGNTLELTVNTQGVPDSTVLYWTIESNANDFEITSGTVTINGNSGTFSVSPIADGESEGTETFTVSLRTGSISGTIVSTSDPITINDADYLVSPVSDNVDEGSSLTFAVVTTNVDDGTTLYWTVSRPEDFSESSGSFVVSSGVATFDVTPLADLSSNEGSETFTVSLRRNSISGTVVATSTSVTINDTSRAPVYAVSPAANNVNEGSSLTFTVTTENVSNDTTLYWTLSRPEDFAVSSGSVTINNNSATFSVTPAADQTTEGSETFTASLRLDSIDGTIVATSSSVTINDTSITLAAPSNTSLPTISGTASVGSTLSSSTGSWTGSPTPTYTYQWQRGTTNISGATSSSYVAQAADAGSTLRCVVTATNSQGSSSANSADTAQVTQAPSNTVAPTVVGRTEIAFPNAAVVGTWTGFPTPTYTYQWQRGTTNISGATNSTYTLQAADVGNTIRCRVTATNSAGSSTVTTASTASIYQPPMAYGTAYQGGFFAGQITTTGGAATHNLVVSPKSSGQTTALLFSTAGTGLSSTSTTDGPTNTSRLVSAGSPAAIFCDNLTIGGYSDWYMPSVLEANTLYRNLKPTTNSNVSTTSGSNSFGLPASPNWVNSPIRVPDRTSATDFRSTGTQFLTFELSGEAANHWTSSAFSNAGRVFRFLNGFNGSGTSNTSQFVRAIRRVPV